MKDRHIREIVSGILLLGAAALPASSQETASWRLYDFGRTRLVKFDLSVTGADEHRKGSCTLGFEPEGDSLLRLSFEGSLGDQGAEFTAFGRPDELYSVALLKMMMTPSAAPLATTIFAPYWRMFFSDRSLELGSEWTFGEGADQLLFKVETPCTQAGLEGARVVWHENGQPRAEACINSGIPLPLTFTYRSQEGVEYDVRMTKYEPRR